MRQIADPGNPRPRRWRPFANPAVDGLDQGRDILLGEFLGLLSELKQSAKGFDNTMRRSGTAFVAKRCQRRMEQLGGVALEGLPDLVTLCFGKVGEAAKQPFEFSCTGLAPAGPQLLDHRRRCAIVHVSHESQRLLVHNRQRGWHLPLAASTVGITGGRKIVDGVEPDSGPAADSGIEVPRHRQIKHHKWPAIAAGFEPQIRLQLHHGLIGSGRADHQIRGSQFGDQFGK